MTPAKYVCVTDGVEVRVRPQFLADESRPGASRYVWAYEVEIENGSDRIWRLSRRRWQIIDSTGRKQQVEGDGVVGQTPVLKPGDVFRYTSGAPLTAPSGIMSGFYELVGEGGTRLDVEIPTFSLDSPHEQSRPS